MMSVLSVAGIRHVLNNIMNDLRPCKIKSRIETNGINDQIPRKTAKKTFNPSVYRRRQTDGRDKFTLPAERTGKRQGLSFACASI